MHINNYSLTIDGLKIDYSNEATINNIQFAPFDTCKILRDLKIIKDFESNKNREPVLIVEQGNRYEWHQFVKIFRIDTTLPFAIAEHHCKHKNEY
jgi:hypothetical protein